MSPSLSAGGVEAGPSVKIVFFGLGAVGSSLLICLAELAERDGVAAHFVVYTIDPAAARDGLFHAEHLFDRVRFVGVPGFSPVFAGEAPHDAELAGAALLVNAALPQFNCPIIELGSRLGALTVDLASDMYDAETERTLTFAQYRHDAALRERGAAALINLGISPGITNFLIGDHINYLWGLGRKDFEIEAVNLYLLEDIDADAVIFSWAPAVALNELSQHPLRLDQGHMETLPPFTGAGEYRFPSLLDTPYAGATHISYPTAVGAAILAWHTLGHARANPGAIKGVLTGEDLAGLLPRRRIDAVRRDLVAWGIDLFEHVRDASGVLPQDWATGATGSGSTPDDAAGALTPWSPSF